MTPSSSLFRASTTKAALARGSLSIRAWSMGRQPVAKTLSYFSLIFLFGANADCQQEKHRRIASRTARGRGMDERTELTVGCLLELRFPREKKGVERIIVE